MLLSLALLASSCATPGEEPTVSDVRVVATEYEFLDVPKHLPAGATTFVVRNRGGEGHDFILTRLLEEDADIPEVAELSQPERERWLGQVAETVIVDPGGVTRLPVTLRPGTYVYLCLATTEAGRTHAYEGMWGEFLVP